MAKKKISQLPETTYPLSANVAVPVVQGGVTKFTKLSEMAPGKQDLLTESNFGTFANALTAKTTLIDADLTNLVDSADSFKAKKITWLNVWNYIKAKAEVLFQKKATASTGSTIQFDCDRIYNSIVSPTTGAMTNNLTGAQIGVIQKIYYNHSTANPFPAGWVRLGSKAYTPSALNIIYAEWVGASRVEYWISQEDEVIGGGDMILASSQEVTGLKTFLSEKLGLRNVANTFTSFIINSNTASRTYTLPNYSGYIPAIKPTSGNQSFGMYSLSNPTGQYNTAMGDGALFTTSSGFRNSAFGTDALTRVTTGSFNTGIGNNAGTYMSGAAGYNNTPSFSVFIGADSKALGAGQTNQIVIGANAIGAGSNTATIGDVNITKTILRGVISSGTTYTVSTLPTGTLGDRTIVTDAVSPTYLAALTGGGSVVCPVFFNGTIWVSN